MTKGLFCEPSLDFVKHTVDSAAMATWLSGWAAYNMEETFPASAKLVQATSEHSSQSERNQPAWNLAHGTSLPILEVLAANPERRNRFAETMVVAGKMHDLDVAHVHMFPWHELGEEAVVVDVGGIYSQRHSCHILTNGAGGRVAWTCQHRDCSTPPEIGIHCARHCAGREDSTDRATPGPRARQVYGTRFPH